MKNILTIARREYNFFNTHPGGYVVLLSILLIQGMYLFVFDFLSAPYLRLAPPPGKILGLLEILLLFSIPALTARLLAEEIRTGTLELMLTMPVRESELVIGKWLGISFFMLTIISFSLVYPITLFIFINPVRDFSTILNGYLGLGLFSFTWPPLESPFRRFFP